MWISVVVSNEHSPRGRAPPTLTGVREKLATSRRARRVVLDESAAMLLVLRLRANAA